MNKYIIYLDGYFLSNTLENGSYWTTEKKNAARFTKEMANQQILYYLGASLIQVH